ncbi:MAG: BREX system P-loop protein BrxC [Chloroflexi bacterium]|uniref:BREX system P-loop protein BrxC n=1 Tax=Candidatus Flexifilum breve TaxID=3140694 RepID=UPI0031372B4B|nr:BREX system P-loop protein BrxC [Chloroflexota bacterium]
MRIIRDLFPAERLDRPIEEVIKLDQQEEDTVRHEIEEYVTTERIQEAYERFLREYGDGLANPDERVGVWISGFFGSGKSSFAKNLGYILQNRALGDRSASDLFMERVRESRSDRARRLDEMIRFINARITTRVIMFDVRLIASQGSEPVHQLMYAKLLEDLDYAGDLDIAELEIELEGEGRLAEFVTTSARLFRGEVGRPREPHPVPVTLGGVSQSDYDVWVMMRKGAQAFQRIVAVLREVSPGLYEGTDSAALLRGRAQLNIDVLVDRTFELASRRAPGHAIAYIIDEVGSYVALSVNKIEDLRKVVEHFGQEGANRVRSGRAVAPVWVMVTSQEKLDEVVQAIDDKRVELARLQDRFAIKIDMSPSDIREVASLRVLRKTDPGARHLGTVYDNYHAQLKSHTRLQQQAPVVEVTREEFIQYYPYLPQFIDLSIQIVSGLRSQSGAFKQLGGSNRTIIKQAHEMLVSERTGVQGLAIGELVTLDRIYDLVEGNLSTEKRTDIADIERQWAGQDWVIRVAKAIALLEYIRGVPRTAENIAALLYQRLGDDSALPDVQAALEALSEAEFIRQTDTGWKLLSLQEKSWAVKRSSFSPTPRDRNTILEEQLRSIFQDKALARYRYNDLRTFQVDVRWNDRVIVDGREQIPLALVVCEDHDELVARRDEIMPDTRNERHPYHNRVFWMFMLNEDIDEVVAELYRSRRMVGEYEGLRSQGSLNAEDTKSLADEKTLALRYEERLRNLVIGVLENGEGIFRGVSRSSAVLGRRLSEIMNNWFAYAVPFLYPKLELGARLLPKKGQEAEDILKAANLNGLSPIFYGGEGNLELVRKDERTSKWVINLEAPIIREIKNYLDSENSYGNKVTGKSLEGKFGGIGYGWEPEILWLVTATLLRGGAIEVTYQGRRYRNHLDPQARAPFTGANAFRSASFAPRKAPDLQVLVTAARRFEDLTGDEVDVEESAIANALQSLARTDLEHLLPLEATVRANHIDALREDLQEYRSTLEEIINSASDDVVNILAGEWKTFQAMRERISAIWKMLDEDGLRHLTRTRIAVRRIAPMLGAEGIDGEVQAAAQTLETSLQNGDYFDPAMRGTINEALALVETAYADAFVVRHTERKNTVAEALQQIRNHPAWAAVFPNAAAGNPNREEQALEEELLKPLVSRGALDTALPDVVTFDESQPTLAQMASDIAAVDRLRADISMRIQRLAAPQERIERVRLQDIVKGQTLGDEADVEALLEEVRDALLELIRAGVKVVLE